MSARLGVSGVGRTVAGFVLVAGVAGGLVACSSRGERVDAHLARARTLIDHQDIERAGVEVRNALQLDPRRARAWRLAGEVEELRDDRPRAYGDYARAAEMDAGDIESRLRMARILVRVREFDQASRRLAEVLAIERDSDAAHALRAAVLAGRGERSAGLALALEVLARDPGQRDAAGVAAGLLMAAGEAGRARTILETAVAANPGDLELRSAWAIVLNRGGERARLQDNLREMIRLAPARLEFRQSLARSLAEADREADAEAVLREAVAALPGDDARRLMLAEWVLERRGTAAARQVLTEQIAERPKAWALQFRLARIEASLGRISQATAGWQAVIRAERSAPAGLEARQQMAEALLREGQLATTQTLLDEILVASPRDNRALLLRARLSLARGETSGAIDDLRSLARDQPGSGEVIGLLAQAYRSRGEPTLARQLIADSLALYPRAGELVVAQAEHLSATGDAQAALRLLDGAIERDPGLARAWEDKAALLAARGDLPGAARTLEAARAALPGLARIAWRQGRFEAAQGHFAAAALAYERAQSLAPADPALGLDVAEAWRRAGQPDRAEAVYRAQLARDPANDLAANNLAWLLQTRDRPGDLDEALALASRFDVSGSANGLDTLGWVRYRRGDVAGAVPVLRRAVAAAPGRPLLLYHLGAALIDAGQVAEGRSLIARALGLQPDFEGARQARERVAAR